MVSNWSVCCHFFCKNSAVGLFANFHRICPVAITKYSIWTCPFDVLQLFFAVEAWAHLGKVESGSREKASVTWNSTKFEIYVQSPLTIYVWLYLQVHFLTRLAFFAFLPRLNCLHGALQNMCWGHSKEEGHRQRSRDYLTCTGGQ